MPTNRAPLLRAQRMVAESDMSRPYHNLSTNGCAAMSCDNRHDEPGLGHEPRSDKRLRAGVNSAKLKGVTTMTCTYMDL